MTTRETIVAPTIEWIDVSDREDERYRRTLAERRAPAVREAHRLLAEDRYDEAEQAIRRVDDSMYGAVEIAKLYRRRLEQLAARGVNEATKPHLTRVFERAVRAAYGAYPEPHTAIEAEQYDTGRETDRAELVRILGYDPRGI